MNDSPSKTCSITACAAPHYSSGLCKRHYERRRRTGSTELVPHVDSGCSVAGCAATHYARGRCELHYTRQKRTGSDGSLLPRKTGHHGCQVSGCDKPHSARGYCGMHYQRWSTHGDPLLVKTGGKPRSGKPWPNRDGYMYVYVGKEHPWSNAAGAIFQHRLVMAEHLGRALLPEEEPHHVNGVRDDNRLENLELWSSSQPAGQRVSDKVAWALELLALYAPERLVS